MIQRTSPNPGIYDEGIFFPFLIHSFSDDRTTYLSRNNSSLSNLDNSNTIIDTKFNQMMADIEQLGEYAREIFENSIEQAMIDFEEAMFGGTLSSVIESIDMLNAKQEELLTTTNKIYETNKMLRNIEKDIEATTNKRAK